MGSTDDAVIWKYANTHSFTFSTKDKDFASLSMVWGTPPKVILLLTGTCSTASVERIIRKNAVRLSEFEADPKRGLLILR
jgi:predicted nuclease of predicted toxin-antitoxin system